FPLRELARALGRDEKHYPLLDRTRRADFPGGQSPYEASRFLGISYFRGARAVSGRDLSFGSVHEAEDDEGPGEGGIQPELHLFHLAHGKRGAHRVFHRAYPDRHARIFSRQPFYKYAGHPVVSSAEGR